MFYAASYFGLTFFVLQNRGMVGHFVEGNLFSPLWDVGVWGAAVFVVCAWLFYRLNRGFAGLFSRVIANVVLLVWVSWDLLVVFSFVDVSSLVFLSGLLLIFYLALSEMVFGVLWFRGFLRVLFGGFLFGLFFEVAGLVLFTAPPVLNLSLGGVGLFWGSLELVFSNLAYPFLPFVYLFFVLLGVVGGVVLVLPWQRLVDAFRGGWLVRFGERLSRFFALSGEGELGFMRRRAVVYLAVLGGAIVSCLFVVFTLLPWVNPTGMLVSVDSPSYYQWIVHMRSVDVNSALGFAFSNDRCLFLVLAYGLSFLVSPLWVVQFASAFLTVTFGVVCYFVLRLVCRFRGVWVFGVLLVPFSFQALGLIYSGYFANMLALILVLSYVVLFFRLLDHWSSLGFLVLLALSVGILFSHSWTWFIFALSLAGFLFLEWRANGRGDLSERFKLMSVLVGVTLGVGLISDLVRKLLSPVSSTTSVVSTATSSLAMPNFGYLFSGLSESVDFVLGGVFANGMLVVLGIIGFLVLIRFKSGVSRFFVAWVFVGSLSILFAAESFVFDRFLFLMPWVVLSALGLFWGIGFVGRIGGFRGWRVWVLGVLLVYIFSVLLNGALRFVFNINIW